MNNKRGISTVVANVLIILLVLAAVAIIWAFIRPLITGTSEQITADCLTLELEVTRCDQIIAGVSSEGGPWITNVSVNRDAGKGDLKRIRFVFTDINGETVVFDAEAEDLDQLGSKKFSFNISNSFEVESVDISPIVVRDIICPLTSVPFTCKNDLSLPLP